MTMSLFEDGEGNEFSHPMRGRKEQQVARHVD